MHHFNLISILFLFNAFILHPIKAETNLLSFDLIHHDSKLSPFYNQSMTESEISAKAVMRSLNRLKHFNSSMSIGAKVAVSDLTVSDYFVKLAISDTTRRVFIPDMLSDLIWVRCKACTTDCEDNQPLVYNPTSSNTYHPILYGSSNCNALGGTESGESNGVSNVCIYYNQAGSVGFSSSGVLATETFYFKVKNEDVGYDKKVFGCDNVRTENLKGDVEGVVGLGQGKLSMAYQMGKKFSYCLPEKSIDVPSKIKFGSGLKLHKPIEGKEYKAKLTRNLLFSSYFLYLEGISVNDKKITLESTKHLRMAIDIQTAHTSLPSDLYDQVIKMFKEQIGDISSVDHPESGATCFLKKDIDGIRNLPSVVFHFTKTGLLNKADFHIKPTTFLYTDNEYKCVIIVSADGGFSVLGSMAQVNKQMIFDLSGPSLTFASLDCRTITS